MTAAILVRVPSAMFAGDTDLIREAYTGSDGVPYLTEMDSYYHVRLVDNYLESGMLGDVILEDGTEWDLHSYYPEGRSADYQPAIVWLTAGLWRLFGGELAMLEYCLAAFMSALTALAAYIIGWRIGGKAGGLTAGILAACGPVFVMRSGFGRFDTDMFIVLMELLLILFMTETLRAGTWKTRAMFAVLFAAVAAVYTLCWAPNYAALFAALTAAGGFIYVLVLIFDGARKKIKIKDASYMKAEVPALIISAGLAFFGIVITAGWSVVSDTLSAFSFSTTSATGEGVLPNLFESIAELYRAKFFPGSIRGSFSGYVAGEAPSVVNGVGGFLALILCFAGLVLLLLSGLRRFEDKLLADSRKNNIIYFCVLAPWLAAGLFLTLYGVRFIEHLSIPVALLTAAFVGRAFKSINGRSGADPQKNKIRKKYAITWLVPAAFLAAAVLPAIVGAARASSDLRPSVTDASANAMSYIKNDTQGAEAVIASWWDMGYYYESRSGIPCLWDGGTQKGARAILVSKALVSDDLELSRRILLMLSSSGDAGIEYLMERTDTENAFDALWEALVMDGDDAAALLQTRCGLTADEAKEAEALIHPRQPKKTYLLITYTMTCQIGWYEYYANWDFTGEQDRPSATLYSYTREGTPIFNTVKGQEYLDNVRGKETMWQLFFNAVSTPCFTPAFEWHDGLEHVRVWKVEP